MVIEEDGEIIEQTQMYDPVSGDLSIQVTICPRSSDPFNVVRYYIKSVTTSWTHSMIQNYDFKI